MDVGKPWSDALQHHRAFGLGLGLESVTSPFTGCTGGLEKGSVGAHGVLSGRPEAGFAGRVLCGEMKVDLQVGPALCCRGPVGRRDPCFLLSVGAAPEGLGAPGMRSLGRLPALLPASGQFAIWGPGLRLTHRQQQPF